MSSTLRWLDFSAEEQRRTREMLRLFEEKESRDELGIGQVRDAFSDLLFPGTSVLLTRARYFLIIPWCGQYADSTAHYRRGRQTLDMVERKALVALKAAAPGEPGIIGAYAGTAVKNLPSVLYKQALERYGIARPAVESGVLAEEGVGEHVTRDAPGQWVSSLPAAPSGFPDAIDGGVRLSREEARWLQDQITAATPDSYLTHVLLSDWLVEGVEWPWSHPAVETAPAEMAAVVDDAELFSLAMHGAALLYNLLISEWYESKELSNVADPVEAYREALADWADQVLAHPKRNSWDTGAMWRRVMRQNPRVEGNVRARRFISDWLDVFVRGEVDSLADDHALRQLIKQRERAIKGAQSRLANEKLLRSWAGASGSRRLAYRWGNVAGLIADIHDGLESSDARA
ncbi:DUF6361 family protein [Modestobacter excelsi]|uniref:DUF6361 family protein n=1 Tax=Modestobacter excelsi TaxID=2213161 RepID=UPI002482C1AD|nr:DUF6361 family protein [Modestobacter excelsi]